MVGTAVSSSLLSLGYAVEGSFAEAVDTYSARITCASIDYSGLSQVMLERGALQQRQNDGEPMIRGPKGGAFTVECELYGHGTTSAGVLTETALFGLLAYGLGGSSSTSVGKAVDGTWSDANSGDLAASATLASGCVVNMGALNDGYGEGQAGVVDNLATNTVTMLTDFVGVPQDADLLYGNQMLYTTDSAEVASTLRFWIGSGNQQYWVRGAALTAISFSGLAEGQVPRVSMTWSCASWEEAAETFPSATATTDKTPTVCGAGSFYAQDFGTTTNALYTPNDFALEFDYQVVPLMGPGGSDTHQNIIGWRRLKSGVKASFTLEAKAASSHDWADWWDTDELSISAMHILYTLSVVDGKRLAIYLPRCYPEGEIYKQGDADGTNRITVSVVCYNSTTTTTDLSLSNMRMAFG